MKIDHSQRDKLLAATNDPDSLPEAPFNRACDLLHGSPPDEAARVLAPFLNVPSKHIRQDAARVLLHVGASLTTLNILAGGSTAFTRDVVSGGNAITEEIQRQLGVSQEEAEAYKCGGAASPDDPNRPRHSCPTKWCR
ncbi:MAG: pilus assembly protein PilM [Nitrospira sp.]|nr:pilus assembly protein PilM [Nitrospira sp.]